MVALFRVLSYLLRLSRDIRFSRGLMLASAVAGIASGLASSGMMALINTMITRSRAPSVALIWAFAGACIALPSFRYLSQVLLTKLTQDSLIVLRLRLTRNILAAPLRQLESIGISRLYASLTGDVGQIVGSLAMIPTLLMHLALVTGSLAYMAYLSRQVLIETLLFIAFGIVTYRMTLARAVGFFFRSRELQNEMMARAREAVEGTKELKMHYGRREAFLKKTEGVIAALQRQTRRGALAFAATSSWGQVLFFVLVGLLVIVMPRFQPVAPKVLVGYTIVLFQMMAPLEVLLSSMPALSQASVSMQALEQLGFSLEAENRETAGAEVEPAPWTLELAGVTHSYRRENEEESFLLGPIDLTFRPGELVFIVGGNGSGKTTLAKLILGLYAPEAGKIRFAGQALTDDNREQYRQNFAVVFSDYFIFKTLYGIEASALDGNARRYLEKLHLEQKVQVQEGELSTVDLSQGQRKRLALLTAYLEDRPIYLFDEWAADQDPIFKRIFYYELLPELKARGKMIFVISHDDHYFHVADRIVKLNYGQLEFDHMIGEFSPAADSASVLVEGTAPA
jgi:putative pyoverdin transport system ATP-binding/permease protein